MNEELTLEGLNGEVVSLKERLDTLEKPQHSVLPDQLDPQSEFVLEQNFSQHSALGRSCKTSTQSINDVAETKIVWEQNTFKNEITWDATNNRFIIRRAGKYLVTATTLYASPATDGLYELLIYKNGAEYSRMATNCSNGSLVIAPTIIDTLSLVMGDYIEIYAFHNSGGAKSISGTAKLCYFNILRIN